MLDFSEFNNLVELEKYMEMEMKYHLTVHSSLTQVFQTELYLIVSELPNRYKFSLDPKIN